MILLLRIIFIVILGALGTIVILGLIKDASGEICTGFMGAQTSCLENNLMAYVVLGLPVLVISGGLILLDKIMKRSSVKNNKARRKKS